MAKSQVIFKSKTYTATVLPDHSLVVTSTPTVRGKRLLAAKAAEWIKAIKTAVDNDEAELLCRAIIWSL